MFSFARKIKYNFIKEWQERQIGPFKQVYLDGAENETELYCKWAVAVAE